MGTRATHEMPSDLPSELVLELSRSRHVLVLTGAGMSAESGIPTFRDSQTGLWAQFRPEDLATPEAFETNPELVWNWYENRRKTVRRARPHAGHEALAWMQGRFDAFTLATQNVDGLHQAAGATDVLELHGNILRSKCHRTGRLIPETLIQASNSKPPRSPWADDGLARPDVVWFGEVLPQAVIEQAMAAASHCDFCFSVGTTSMVQPAASIPILALERGCPVVEINPQETPLSRHARVCIRGRASESLVAVRQQLQQMIAPGSR